jgi:hypothetical protein
MTITILLVLAFAFTFAVVLRLSVESPHAALSSDPLDPAASTTRGVLFDRKGTPRRYY